MSGGQAGQRADLDALLKCVPFLSGLDRMSLSRLVGRLEECHFAPGEMIIAEGATADALYLIETGSVNVSLATEAGERVLGTVNGPASLGELGLFLDQRTSSATAVTNVKAWRLARSSYDDLVTDRPAVGLSVARAAIALLARRERESAGAPIEEGRAPAPVPTPRLRNPAPHVKILGALLMVALPLALWWVPPPADLSPTAWRIIAILLGAGAGWLFEPLPEFAVALLTVGAWGVTGLVPLSAGMAGFTGSSWAVSLASLALAAAMARSGLLMRIALRLLRIFPATHAGQVAALMLGGLMVTPLVPLGIARVAAAAPLVQELADRLGYAPRSRGSAGLAFAGLAGYGMLSSIFLTGLVMNFFVFDLLPASDRVRFGWAGWLLAALPAGCVIVAGTAAVAVWFFRPEEKAHADPQLMAFQQAILGPITPAEWTTLTAMAVLVLGLVLEPLLQIRPEWLALGALGVTIGGGVITRETFRSGIDWGFLVFFGVLLGTGGVLKQAGIVSWVSAGIAPIGHIARSPIVIMLGLVVVVAAVRLVLPWISATLLLSLALVPAAPALGLSPWVAGFVVLVTASAWLHPNQSGFVHLIQDSTKGKLFTQRQAFQAGVALTVITALAVFASIPYWQALGLLRAP